MEYDDFSIWFEPSGDGCHGVVAQSASGGVVRGTFTIPFPLDEIGQVLRATGAGVRHLELLSADEETPSWTPREVGERLFDALFSGAVRNLFDHSWGQVEASRDRGLRLRLRFDLEGPGLVRLASLPWELLYWRQRRQFLVLSRSSPVVRQLNVASPVRELRLVAPLRILVAMSPASGFALDLEAERRKIEESWGGRDDVEVVRLSRATPQRLQQALEEETFHVLHFMGHGELSAGTGDGALLFNDGEGGEVPVRGEVLGRLLHDQRQLRLVVLNACDSARTTSDDGLDPFAGVATALVMARVPAVLAMQLPISDRAALAFSEGFYGRLASGETPEAATAAGRRAILGDDVETQEWATPALYLRGVPVPRPSVERSRKRPWLVAAALTVLPLLGLLGYATQRARESLLGMAPLDYPAWKLFLGGADALWWLPWRGLGSLFLGEGAVLHGAVVLLALTLLGLGIDRRRRLPAWSVVAALAVSSLVLVGGGAFYANVLQSAHLTANGPRSEPRCGTRLTRNLTDMAAFEVCSWLENDSPGNDVRRESLAGLLFWLLLACLTSAGAGSRYALAGRASNLRWILAVLLGGWCLFLLARLPLVHAYATWGLRYPPVESILPECDGELSRKIATGACTGFDVSAGARQKALFLRGDCESFAILPLMAADGRGCVRQAPTERGVLGF